MQKQRATVHTAKKRGRRDIVSEGLYPCRFCPDKNAARVRDIRKHLVDVHNSWSFFKCEEILANGEICNFYCHHGLGCFVHHAEIVHNNFYYGASTRLDEEDSFSLILCDLDQKQKTHSVICKEAKAVNRNSKKSFMRRRGECEEKILENFLAGSVSTDLKEKMKHYRAGFTEVKRLLKEFPRRHNRLTENTTLKKKEFQFYLDEYLRLLKSMKK